MTPYFDRFGVTLWQGDALAVLASLPEASVQCCVTSPPYYSLRAYGTDPVVWDGDPACAHEWGEPHRRISSGGPPEAMRLSGGKATTQDGARFMTAGAFCRRCGAWRGELGSEPTPDLYVRHLVAIFAAVRRVLRADGLCWVNVGDSFNSGTRFNPHGGLGDGNRYHESPDDGQKPTDRPTVAGIPPKNLLLIPFRLALALQEDGWVVRQTVIWSKRAPMPESVRDRPTTAHEYVLMLAKSERYFYDQEAVREPHGSDWLRTRHPYAIKGNSDRKDLGQPAQSASPAGRNLRSVWELSPSPFSAASLGITDVDHFAAYPEELARRAIRASTSERGACPACGAPWERVVERMAIARPRPNGATRVRNIGGRTDGFTKMPDGVAGAATETTGWRPTCTCSPAEPVPCVVMDIFAGTGTTLRAAQRLGRRAVGIELSADYCRIAEARAGRQGTLDFAPDAGTEAAAG